MPVFLANIGKWFANRVALKLVSWFVDWASKYVPHILKEWKRKKERELAQSEAKKEYDKVIADEGSTKEERMAAYEKFTNSGR